MASIWAVGDSLTYGTGWPADTPGGWRALVADRLAEPVRWVGSVADNPAPGRAGDRHDGHPGWRVDQLAGLPAYPADLVIAQGGTNDLVQRWGAAGAQRYDEFDEPSRERFAAELAGRLADWWRRLGVGRRLLVWTIPPAGRGGPLYQSPTLIAANLLIVNEVVPALTAAGLAVTLADVATALAPDGALTPGLIGTDGVHPTPAGYTRIAELLAPLTAAALAGPASGQAPVVTC